MCYYMSQLQAEPPGVVPARSLLRGRGGGASWFESTLPGLKAPLVLKVQPDERESCFQLEPGVWFTF